MTERKYKIKLEGFPTPKNHNEFVKLLKDATFGEYEIDSKFSMMNGYAWFIHKECGTRFWTSPYKLLVEGRGCPNCKKETDISHILFKNKHKDYITHSDFAQKVFEKYSTEFVVLDIYKTNKTPIKIIHTKCGEIFKRTPDNILNSNILCPKCNPRVNWNLKKIKKEISEKTQGEFEVVSGTYKTVDTPIKIKHNICGNIFTDTFNAFMKTPKCGICETDMSLNEKYIKDFFIKNKIDFKREYGIDGCKNRQLLKFDFAVFNNNELICLIEYDGQQHYYPVFGEDSFIRAKAGDGIKNKFCKENNIKLIRIPFWESNNLEKILKKEMKKLKIM